MALSISNESKNNVNITNENKPTSSTTWDDMTVPWNSVNTTWAQPGTPITKESKNNVTITNESKS